MKRISRLLLLSAIVLTFSSCAVIYSLLGMNECAQKGCSNEALDNCNYCRTHCQVPFGAEENMKKSLDKQIERSHRMSNY